MTKCLFCNHQIGQSVWYLPKCPAYTFCSKECAESALSNLRFCSHCRNLINGKSWVVPGGGLVCLSCYEKSISTHEKLNDLYSHVLMSFLNEFSYEPPCGVEARFFGDDPDYNKRIFFVDPQGYLCHMHIPGKGSICRIYVQKFLSDADCQSTLAHELAHDMMYHLWGTASDIVISEGFAVYMESLFNIHNGHPELNEGLAEERKTGYKNDPYSVGYLQMKDIAACSGYSGVLNFMQLHCKK